MSKENHNKWNEKIRKGDKTSFEWLFKEYYFVLVRFAWRYTSSKAVAEEIVQDIFADIWEHRSDWNPPGSIKTYLYKVTKNQAIDFLRHEQVKNKYDPKWMDQKENPTINFKDRAHRKQMSEAIKKEIEDLPPRSKMTFKLHRYDGLTYNEIAEVMDISIKTVESQMTRTLKRLRNRLSYLLPFIALGVYLLIR